MIIKRSNIQTLEDAGHGGETQLEVRENVYKYK